MTELKKIRIKLMKQFMWGSTSWFRYMRMKFFRGEDYYIYRFLLHLRRYEYLIKKKTTLLIKIRRIWNLRKYSIFAKECGFVIGDGVLGEGVVFYHRGNIVINPNARVGDGCYFHGTCCIGNSHPGETKCPIIGKNVDIGYGAVILGDIHIADNIVIGANSVVTKSFDEPGIVIAGAPARKIRDRVEK